jgi:hypothetical protein
MLTKRRACQENPLTCVLAVECATTGELEVYAHEGRHRFTGAHRRAKRTSSPRSLAGANASPKPVRTTAV